MASLKYLEDHILEFKDLPKEAVIKQDILRDGLDFSLDSLKIAKGYKPKDYFIFSFDLVPIKDMKKEENLNAPEEIKISGGIFGLKKTVISVRLNPSSPYKVDLYEGKLIISLNNEYLADVEYHPVPVFYHKKLSNGKKISEIAPVLEWGYLVYLTVYRMCQYFNKEEQCQFCDLNKNYKQQRESGRDYTGVKSLDEILEALELIAAEDTISRAITITGGSIITGLQKKTEVEFYAPYAKAIHNRFGDRWLIKAVVQAYEKQECQTLKDSGVSIYHPNFEVWDKDLWPKICPGKTRWVGREEWMKRIVDSAEIFGPENVIPNFVGGVEMNKNYGYSDVDQAIASTKEGLEFFMSKKIMPRFTSWCPEPYAKLGAQEAPKLEYFMKLLRVFRETFHKYDLPNPKGYGPTGPGNAVFSVSAFMDVL